MKNFSFGLAFLLGLLLVVLPGSLPGVTAGFGERVVQTPGLVADTQLAMGATAEEEGPERSDTMQPFAQVIRDAQKLEGLFTLYYNAKTNKLFAEIKPEQLNVNYLATTTLESGIGESGLYSGLPISDFLFYFRRVNNSLHFAVRNVNFRAQAGDPLQRSVKRSFSDSVLHALPIRSIHPERKTLLVDLGTILLGDFPNLSTLLSETLGVSYALDPSKSYLSAPKAFPLNVELESTYNFSSKESAIWLDTLPDSRALTLRVRYSFSRLPEKNAYRPRLADERVGYFLTAYQDLSDDRRDDPFVRYINRWQLEKQNPQAALSPPKQPILFWIENTVPMEYRDTVRDGVLMWNRAFEKIGFQDAIQVRQMPDNATWDPADIRYNTIRWFNSLDATFAMGPSRVNPLTGQILDADIIVDASFVRYIKRQAQLFAGDDNPAGKDGISRLMGNGNQCTYKRIPPRLLPSTNQADTKQAPSRPNRVSRWMEDYDVCYGTESSKQFAAGATTLALLGNAMPSGPEMKTYVHQFLRELIAHEVGHTLGLRHNFRASAMLPPEALNDTNITQTRGLVGSVMDYNAPNLAPKGVKQGDYFTTVVGPYDEWAIAYGYQPIAAASTTAELRELRQIAQRSPQPELAYATDEDLFSFLDPQINAFDLGQDVITYSRWQMDNAQEMWKRLDKRYPIATESYSEARNVFNTVFFQYLNFATFLPQYVGGQSFSRNHGGDPNGRLPFTPVSLAQQRQALTTINEYVFDEQRFQFSPDLLNKLAPSRWRHWGSSVPVFRLDYPIYDLVFLMQRIVLSDLFSPDRLVRLRDAELKTKPGEALTIPELFNTVQAAIWREANSGEAKWQAPSSLRRALQRDYRDMLIEMVLRNYEVPADAQTVAWYELKQLRDQLGGVLRRNDLDTYTRAHFEESRDRINKALTAQIPSR